MTTITAPAASFTGRSVFGTTALEFVDGTAEFTGELPNGVRQYLLAAGYAVDGIVAVDVPLGPPEPADPRDFVGPEQVGTPARDGAVDPRPGDFLAPTNAGQANPHGPDVVSPGIHAIESLAVLPGPVGRFDLDDVGRPVVVSDTDEQDRRETAFAQAVLTGENTPVPEASLAAVEGYPDGATLDPTGPPTDSDGDGDGEMFDPGAHTVVEVTAYLADADDTEKQRVIAAEKAGHARKGIVGADA